MVAPKDVITTTYGVTNDDEVVKLTTFCFQWPQDAGKIKTEIRLYTRTKIPMKPLFHIYTNHG